ncbi:MAG TPA: LptA/OstA family protein [Nitrospiria bacterium]|jgi:lipopolysaccharide export system protein LptA
MRKMVVPFPFTIKPQLFPNGGDFQKLKLNFPERPLRRRVGLLCLIFFVFFLIDVPSKTFSNQFPSGSRVTEAIGTKQINIRSNELVFYGSENKVFFKGNVVVEYEDMILEADDVLLFLQPGHDSSVSPQFSFLGPRDDHQVEKIEADGHVVFQGGNHRGRSEHAEFYKEEGIVILTGDPEVWEGESLLAGSKITVLLKERKSIVEESRVTLQPQEKEKKGLVTVE